MQRFDAELVGMLRAKLGLATADNGDSDLVQRLLGLMQSVEADFTLTFRRLAGVAAAPAEGTVELDAFTQLFTGATDPVKANLEAWIADWQRRLSVESLQPADRAERMRRSSPAFIPRNHLVEAALNAASDREDLVPFNRLLRIVQRPYEDQPDAAEYALPPRPSEQVLQTFCGT